MKKAALIVLLFISFTGSSISWDSTAAKFYPLAIGNVWSYHHVSLGGSFCVVVLSQYDFAVRIVRDTLMPNGKRYFRFSNGDLERIDSNSMNVYGYHSSGERIIDSLLAIKNDYFKSYRSGDSATHRINDTLQIICFGISRQGKQISGNGLIGHHYMLVSGLGLYSEGFCKFGGSTETLNGCIINGVLYGQIIGLEKSEQNILLEFELSQNYPNPFNPYTKIKFSLPAVGERHAFHTTKLIIYDVLGREITTLVNEQLQPGTYEVEWDASNYTSGVYFYKLITAEFVENRKMVLIK